jgi:hypothetical protein
MSNTPPSIRAHHDPSPTHFTLTLAELEGLENCARNPAREYLLFCAGLFLPTLANFLTDLRKTPLEVSPTLVLNGMVSVCSLLMGIFLAFSWWRARGQMKSVLQRIKGKPLTEMIISNVPSTNFVSLPPITPVSPTVILAGSTPETEAKR